MQTIKDRISFKNILWLLLVLSAFLIFSAIIAARNTGGTTITPYEFGKATGTIFRHYLKILGTIGMMVIIVRSVRRHLN